jgi:glucose-6-phosphate isomerase
MGGSSLAPEVLRSVFGQQPGYPRLQILESTVPRLVTRALAGLDLDATVFIVASKFGDTIEVLSLFQCVYGMLSVRHGSAVGRYFVAITDAGTSLAEYAGRYNFRELFLNAADIGGRYSALSFFGVVPAALMGLDGQRLLQRAAHIAMACRTTSDLAQNPGASLAAILAAHYGDGRSKLTLVTSPQLAAVGLWIEQLLAESTGKHGKGMLPIASEPWCAAGAYGADRVFVYLRLVGVDNGAADRHAAALEVAGQPVVRLELADVYDIAAQFFVWQFAVALLCAALGVNAFDQPNVLETKLLTAKSLKLLAAGGKFASLGDSSSLGALLGERNGIDCLVVLAYLDEFEVGEALAALRLAVLRGSGLASTLGYGPRYLHSTGQFHKGGPDTGLYLMLIDGRSDDVAIPDAGYGFRSLMQAQAAADYDALLARGRRVGRVVLNADSYAQLTGLLAECSGLLRTQAVVPRIHC